MKAVTRLLLLCTCVVGFASDWPEWRGPQRDGTSAEKGLPEHWSPAGDNLLWRAPYGARSGPIVLGDRIYLMNTAGNGATLQERVLCLDADTGRLLWEYKFNVYQSDVPPHRAGWASPAADPLTGNVYAFSVGAHVVALSRDGKLLWERPLAEELGMVTTHGGRTPSPVVEDGLVVVSGVTSGWGATARAAHRFVALDKLTGDIAWVSTPGTRPYDTTYSPPLVAAVNGTKLFIVGGGDGAVHALKLRTGEPVWKFEMAKRGLNTGVVLNGTTAIVSHSEENLDTSEMGLLAAIDATSKGAISRQQVKWAVPGFQGGFSSPVLDGDRVIQVDNGAVLHAFDAVTGRPLWRRNLGTIQKSSPLLADGKLYVGTENGKFYILRPRQDRVEVLDEDLLGAEPTPEAIIGSPAISRGRILVPTVEALYCIGKKKLPPLPARPFVRDAAPAGAVVAHVQVVPAEMLLKPGESVQFRARRFDAQGRLIGEGEVTWSVEQLKGSIEHGRLTAASDPVPHAGLVKAVSSGVTGSAAVRVVPPLPWSQDFEKLPANSIPRHWINATGKFVVREIDGNKVLVKLADNPFTKRARVFMGPSDWSGYTVQVDVMATERRRQMGDGGVVAQRYALVLFGNNQRLELQAWQPETQRTAAVPFAWKANTWYRVKLRVENLPDGTARARGKAWPAGEPEPQNWTVERVDPIPNRQGAPGLYADAPFEVYFDNLKVTWNE